MGLEAATYIDDLVTTNPTSGDARSEGDDHIRNIKSALKATIPGMIGRMWRSQTKSANYNVVSTDNLTRVKASAAITVTADPAATLGNGWRCELHASGGAITLDPNGAETVNDATTLTIAQGSKGMLSCDGTSFFFEELKTYYGALTAAVLAADQNNYAPVDSTFAAITIDKVEVVNISASTRVTITGIAGGINNRRILFINTGTNPILFAMANTSSSLANRFAIGMTLGGGQAVWLTYYSSRWRFAGAVPEPIGTVKDFATSILPADYITSGSTVSRTTYVTLFNEIGTTWGVGDGSTTFVAGPPSGHSLVAAGTGTQTDSGTTTEVDTAGDTLTVPSNATKWITGKAVVFTLTSGTITGLTSGNTYYVVRSSATLIKLASSLALAVAGTGIDLTAKSSPIWTITHTLTARTHGELLGEEVHAQLGTEVAPHTHDVDSAPDTGSGNGNITNRGTGDTGNYQATGNVTGLAQTAGNVMQPSAVMTRGIKYC